ncbi:SpoVR family protein [Novosphingobium endophyticum]|uniref:SpoVR family protein n=1 Tax=Novosphingobium endophyticum TaxID=1955250 RepID=A0A916X5D8_9SPHN|nr:SpoVR family protein [Novosphingobium endophyticum]GGC08843.1 SpoVR family protein [Novosphingobium endophyticum]
MNAPTSTLLYRGSDWDFDTLQRIYDAVERIAIGELGLNVYPNRIEVITSEQMLDAYASTGMPIFYKHWSFGKQFLANDLLYRKGLRGLAYELVINSDPCISYVMEENSATMQTLVIAHAAFGHNHFFKNNYVFKQWTDAEGILDYLEFARHYIARCEERHGQAEVERLLDAAHALMQQGIHRYPRAAPLNLNAERRREEERRAYEEATYNPLWRTLPKKKRGKRENRDERRRTFGLPQENVLYFLEKSAPRLRGWQREILRIVRLIAQYFYPQRQTKVMNEGCAVWCHYRILERLHKTGQISDGAFMEFLHSHSNVLYQPVYDSGHYGGHNPYALGFGIMQDIERICIDPTEEDRLWFPEFAGGNEPVEVLKNAWANYRDESFVAQFLSPHLIRKWRLFKLDDNESEDEVRVAAIHDEQGYREIRRTLARHHDVAWQDPDIQIVDVDFDSDRKLLLEHSVRDKVLLEPDDAERVLQHLADLWGYEVILTEVSGADRKSLNTYTIEPRPGLFF